MTGAISLNFSSPSSRFTLLIIILPGSEIQGVAASDIKETILGSAEIQKIFKVSSAGKIAGSKVISGEIKSKSKARIIRDGVESGEWTFWDEKGNVTEVKNFDGIK